MNNKNLFPLKAAAAAVIFVAVVSGCAKDPKPTYPDVESVTISEPALTLEVGESATLTAKVSPEGVESTDVEWSCDNAAVATVDAATGEVRGVAVGTAVITATSRVGGKSGQCAVTVAPENILDAITDPVFKAYAQFCMKNKHKGWDDYTNSKTYEPWDTNQDEVLSWEEAAAVECIYLEGGYEDIKVGTLEGIGYFTGLKSLFCSKNELKELDVTKNTALEFLECYNNQLKELDVRQNIELRGMRCNNNQLTKLDVTKNTSLEWLFCFLNQLTELNVTQNTALRLLHCPYNRLKELDVTTNIALTSLDCYSNQLTELDASKMVEPEEYWLCCGSQKDGEDNPQTLTLTLREEQKPRWDSKWASISENSNVDLAGE